MRRLWFLTCLAGAAGIGCGTSDLALRVVVKVDPGQRATCAVLEVSDGTTVVVSQDLRRDGRDELVVGLRKGDLPTTITLKAKAFLSSDGCQTPRNFNGESPAVEATFPSRGVTTVELTLPPPSAALDADGDGYVPVALGGTDCNDGDASIHPGVAQLCGSAIDQDCDGLAGCADADCTLTAACQRAPDRLAFVTGPVTVDARTCSPAVAVEAQDAAGATAAQQGLPVVLAANPSAGVTFYSDSTCTAAITGVTILQGETRASFYFRSTTGGSTFTASATVFGLLPASQLETITNPLPTQLAYSTPARTALVNTCSAALTIELRDAANLTTQVAGAVTVTVTGAPATGLQLFSDATCATQLSGSAFTIPANSSSGTFYARSTKAPSTVLTAASSGLTSATQTFTITPAAPTQLRFATGPQGIGTAVCSSVVRVESQDVYGNPSPLAAATPVALTAVPSAGFTFYSDANCATAVTQVTIAAAGSSASFYFRGTTAGSVTMTANGGVGLGSDTQTAGIGAGPPAMLSFTTAAQSNVVAGVCSGIVTVQSRDASSNPSNITGSALAVVLAATPAVPLQFFSDSGCTAGITGTSIPIGGTTASFYFKSTLAGAVQLGVSSSLAAGDTQIETVVATTATAIRFTNTAFSPVANVCTGPLTVEARDQYGNAAQVFALTAVTLSSAPAGVTFFAAAGCGGGGTTTVNIPNGGSSIGFYARATVAAAYNLTAAGAGLGLDTQAFTVSADVASKLVFSPLTSNVVAGACSAAVAVQRQDQFNNPVTAGGVLTVNLTSNAAGPITFHTASNCSVASTVTAVGIPALGSSATLYMRDTTAEAVTVTGQAGGIGTNATHTLTVGPDVADRLVFTPPSQGVVAGACSGAVVVERRDQFSNPVTSGGALTVNLTSTATGGTFTFHTAANCSGASAVTGVGIAALGSSATFYLRATKAEAVTVTGQASGIGTNATHALAVSPDVADRLVFAPLTSGVVAGACSGAVVVERQDQFSNPVTAGGALTVNLTSNSTGGAFTFHTASNCSGASSVTSVDIAALGSNATLYLRSTKAEVVTVTGQAGGIGTNATHTLTVSSDVADKLVFNPLALASVAGACTTAVTVQRQDQFNNPATGGGAQTVNLTSNATGGFTFHTASNCSGGSTVSSVGIAALGSTATFYMRGTVAEPVTVTGQASGIATNATHALTVGPDAVSKLVFSPLNQTVTAGACSAIVSVERRDQFDNPITTGGALAVNLTSTATLGLTFHSASNCNGGSTITGVTIAALASNATFYVRATRVEPVTVTGQAAGVGTNATHVLTINPDVASKVGFTVAPLTVNLGVCSTAITIQQQDQFGNAVNVVGDTAVALTDDSTNFDFHLVAGCGDAAATTATILNGSAVTTFYVQSPTGDLAATMTATIAGGIVGSQDIAVVSPATQVAITTTARSITGGQCSLVLTAQLQDGANAPVLSGAGQTLNLSSNATSNATGGLTFYTDNACATAPVTTAQILAGQSSVDFYVKANVAEVVTLTVSDGGPLTDATQGFTTTVGPAAKLMFTSGAQTVASLACSGSTVVQLQDLGGNPVLAGGPGRTIGLAGSGGTVTAFYTSLANCNADNSPGFTGGVASFGMAAVSSTGTFFWKAQNGPTTTLTASTSGITNGTEVETLGPAAATHLVFTTTAPTVEAGFCQTLTVERQDALNRATAPTSATPVTLALPAAPAAPLLPLQFFSDAACTVTLAQPFNILSGATNTVAYVKGSSGSIPGGNQTAAQATTVTASAPTLAPNPTLAVTVLPMVRRGTCNLENNETSTTTSATPCTISLALQSTSRTFLIFQASASTTDDSSGSDNVTCYLNSTTEIICERAANGAAIPITWQTVSFAYDATAGGVSVQHLAATCNAQPLNVPVTSTAAANSFVLFSSRSVGASNAGDDFFTVAMTSDTNVQILQPSNGGVNCSATANFRLQVVTWANANVVHAVTTAGAGFSYTAAQATPNLGRTFLLHTSRMADVVETGNDMCSRRLRGAITNGTTLTFDRPNVAACTADNMGDISWQRVELPASAAVQQIAISDNNGGNKAITSVDRTRSFVLVGGMGPGGASGGRTDYAANDTVGSSQLNLIFNSAIRFDYTRGSGDGNGDWTAFVVQVTP